MTLQSGVTLPNAKLTYKTYGSLDADGGNVIVHAHVLHGHPLPQRRLPACGAGGSTLRAGSIVSIDMFGNGLSSSPSNTAPPFDGPRFPEVTLHDNVACQHRLLTEVLG